MPLVQQGGKLILTHGMVHRALLIPWGNRRDNLNRKTAKSKPRRTYPSRFQKSKRIWTCRISETMILSMFSQFVYPIIHTASLKRATLP